MLKEAEEILSRPVTKAKENLVDRAERLERLGFTQTQEVQKASGVRAQIMEQNRKKEMSLQLAELIRYYKQTYPFQKFLTEEELNTICGKYGLIHAPVGAYKGSVPEKNLAEIERAQALKACDAVKNKFFFQATELWSSPARCHPEVKALMKKGFEVPCVMDRDYQIKNFLMGKGLVLDSHIMSSVYMFRAGHTKTIQFSGLFICAPKRDFDLSKVENTQSGYHTVTRHEIKDPIVYRYCRGGIQVLSKWGLEASDPALLNEIDN